MIVLFIPVTLLVHLMQILKNKARMEYYFSDALVNYNLLLTVGVKLVSKKGTMY